MKRKITKRRLLSLASIAVLLSGVLLGVTSQAAQATPIDWLNDDAYNGVSADACSYVDAVTDVYYSGCWVASDGIHVSSTLSSMDATLSAGITNMHSNVDPETPGVTCTGGGIFGPLVCTGTLIPVIFVPSVTNNLSSLQAVVSDLSNDTVLSSLGYGIDMDQVDEQNNTVNVYLVSSDFTSANIADLQGRYPGLVTVMDQTSEPAAVDQPVANAAPSIATCASRNPHPFPPHCYGQLVYQPSLADGANVTINPSCLQVNQAAQTINGVTVQPIATDALWEGGQFLPGQTGDPQQPFNEAGIKANQNGTKTRQVYFARHEYQDGPGVVRESDLVQNASQTHAYVIDIHLVSISTRMYSVNAHDVTTGSNYSSSFANTMGINPGLYLVLGSEVSAVNSHSYGAFGNITYYHGVTSSYTSSFSFDPIPKTSFYNYSSNSPDTEAVTYNGSPLKVNRITAGVAC